MDQEPVVAHIREADCIGCTKCLQACPVDAIVGGAKWMHTVISAECTGCGLCVAPCPVDCIDLLPISLDEFTARQLKANHHQMRIEQREIRLQKRRQARSHQHQVAKNIHQGASDVDGLLSAKRAYIQEALARVKQKKLIVAKGNRHEQ